MKKINAIILELDFDPKILSDAWYILMRDKRIITNQVLERIYENQISAEQLKDEQISSQVKQKGYYDIIFSTPQYYIDVLDFLTDLGYLNKTVGPMYRVHWFYSAHPYVPYIHPPSLVGLNVNSDFRSSYIHLNLAEYQNFVETANELKAEIAGGQHKHITAFDYSIESYETTVYEVKERYFDALGLFFDIKEKKLLVYTTEPFIVPSDEERKHDNKNWKKVERMDEKIFLSGANEIDIFIDKLEWKKKFIGIIIHDNKAYYMEGIKRTKQMLEKERQTIFDPPKLLGGESYSIQDFFSHVFEDRVLQYLEQNENYTGVVRYVPKYLGKEIDVFAERGTNIRDIKVCECKLRLNDKSLTKEELEDFEIKFDKITSNENPDGKNSIEFCVITNATTLDDGVHEYAKQKNIFLFHATLSKNWKKSPIWKVLKLSSF